MVILAAAGGVALGFAAASLLRGNETMCCGQIRAAARGKAVESLPSWLVGIGDVLNAWDYAPGLLELTGGI